MSVNADKPLLWKADIARSVDFYNAWFMDFAPDAYRKTRVRATEQVEWALRLTENLTQIEPHILGQNPAVLPMLRMATAPPIARDRLIGLAQVSPNLVRSMEIEQRLPPQMKQEATDRDLGKIGSVILRLADRDIFPWLDDEKSVAKQPSPEEVYRASTIVADRLCGATADPIIRNAQEQRQLATLEEWLVQRGYVPVKPNTVKINSMPPGTFTFRLNVPIKLPDDSQINIPIDAVVMPKGAEPGKLPLLIEAKSAGDFTNTNKRRKEEAIKISQLKANYGATISFVLFLCGYFDSGYLGYEAAEGIDWVWEHRLADLLQFGL